MDSFTIAGLPMHVLLVHAVVILTPLTALAVLMHAFWPAAARRLGVVTPLAALVVLVLVPITVSAGQALEKLVPETPAVEHHADLGGTLLPWAIGLFVVALALWLWTRFGPRWRKRMPPAAALTIDIVLRVLAVVAAVGILIDVVLIGDAGARAVWGDLIPG
jgi:hypothetical protein